jgi:hypothetical protein
LINKYKKYCCRILLKIIEIVEPYLLYDFGGVIGVLEEPGEVVEDGEGHDKDDTEAGPRYYDCLMMDSLLHVNVSCLDLFFTIKLFF